MPYFTYVSFVTTPKEINIILKILRMVTIIRFRIIINHREAIYPVNL